MSDEMNLIIDLDKLDSLSPLGENEYIRRDAIRSMKDRIISAVKDNVEAINRQHDSNGYDADFPLAQHPCFFINGGRGSGKSTLLRGLREALLKGKLNIKYRIENLAHIDPSELAEGESFFIYILSCIAKKLEKSILNGCSYGEDARRQSIKNAQDIIQKMAQGLKLLQNVDRSLYQSEDAGFFIEDSIAKCGSSRELKNKFYELTDELHKICGCDVFLVTIDDADLNFSRCYHILETVRKYMISPRMVFVFAGDIKLYSHICRDAHIQNFDTKTLQYDDTRKDQRRRLLDNLEDQYILKMFPGYNRVNLSLFGELLYGRLSNAVLTKEKNGKAVSAILPRYLRCCMQYIYPTKIYPFIEDIFSAQSMRTMLQLIRAWSNYIPVNNQNDNSNTDLTDVRKIINGLIEGIQSVFSQVLMDKNVDYSAIHNSNSIAIVKEILIHTVGLNISTGDIALTPTHGDTNDRVVFLYLNAASMRYMTHYSRILSYMLFLYPQIVIAYSIGNKVNAPADVSMMRSKILQQYSLVENLNYSRYGAWITSKFAPNMISGSNNVKRYGKGVIRLMKERRNKEVTRLSFKDFIKELSKEISSSQHNIGLRFLLAIYHSICAIETDKETYFYLSTYCYYEVISAILNDVRIYGNDFTEKNVEEILSMDNNFYFMRISDPVQDDSVEEKDDFAEYKTLFSAAYEKCKDAKYELISDILKWANKYQEIKNICYPADVDLAWKSFLSRCESATDDAALAPSHKKFVKAGELFKRYVNAMKKAFAEYLGTTPHKKKESEIDDKTQNTLGKELQDCLEEFPLWAPFKEANSEYASLWQIVDKLNVGAYDKKTSSSAASQETAAEEAPNPSGQGQSGGQPETELGEAEEPSEQSTPTSGKSQEDAAEEAPNPSGQGQPDGQPETEPRARRTRRRNARSSAETQTPDAGNDKSPKTVRELVNGETPENPQ